MASNITTPPPDGCVVSMPSMLTQGRKAERTTATPAPADPVARLAGAPVGPDEPGALVRAHGCPVCAAGWPQAG